MKATIEYSMQWMPDPFNEERRAAGGEAWVLCKVVRPDCGFVSLIEVRLEPLAVFNFDSEAKLFQRHLIEGGTVLPDTEFARNHKELSKS